MSAPVDVLGLFDAYIAHGIPQERKELQAARAAVAELIEAANEFLSHDPARGTLSRSKARTRLIAALANIGGAK